MQILIASDIHANFSALQKLEKDIIQSDYIFFLGDFIGYNPEANEVINYVKTLYNCYCLMGNHDYYLIHNDTNSVNDRVRQWIQYTQKIISPENLNWLKNLPTQLSLTIHSIKFLLQHGSPENPLFEYIYPDSKKFNALFELNYDIICMGHTHHYLQKEKGKKIILNPGSVGQPRDDRTQISYCIYHLHNLETNRIEHKKIAL